MPQFFDKKGTTTIQQTFIDKEEWSVHFAQGFIAIRNDEVTSVKLNYNENTHWTYEEHEANVRNGYFTMGAEIKHKLFTLAVDVSECSESESVDGFLTLDNKIATVVLPIPYGLALSLIKFMSGSTDLEGVLGLIRT